MRDFLAFAAGSAFLALIAWMLLAAPKETRLTMETSRSLAEPDPRLITERSPYMRTER